MQHTKSSTLKGLGNGKATASPLVVPSREYWLTGFISVVCAVLVTAALWLLLLQPPKLVTFDMKGTTDRFCCKARVSNSAMTSAPRCCSAITRSSIRC